MTSIDATQRGTAATAQSRTAAPPRFAASFARRFAFGLLLPVAALVLWQAGIRFGLFEGRLMPAPTRIAAAFWEMAASGALWTHVLATLARVGAGFAIGSVAGTVLGALSGSRAIVRALIDPTIQALRAIPSIAWVPLFILWFGIFETSKVTLIAVGVFFPVYLGVMGAIVSVDRKLIEVGRIFRLSPLALAWRVLVPAVMPAWVVALRTGLGLGFMFVAAAEIMGASEGLGFVLMDGQQLGKPDELMVALVAFALVGQTSDALLVLATRPLLAWQDTDRRPF